MWYKYLRNAHNIRVFRRTNLKFNQDDLGMMKTKAVSNSTDLLFRLGRSQGNLRGFALIFTFGFGAILSYLKAQYLDPVYTAPKLIQAKRADQELDRKARQTLVYNNMGIPTQPTRSLENLVTFMTSTEAINKNILYLTYGLELNADQLKGLDSSASENDERMLELFVESKAKSGGH